MKPFDLKIHLSHTIYNNDLLFVFFFIRGRKQTKLR